MTTAPGWYPDPSAPGQQRYWDGAQWTEQVAPEATAQQPPPTTSQPPFGAAAPYHQPGGQPYYAGARTPMTPEQSRQWAMLAHLSALAALIIGFSFIGPLIVYLVKKDEDAFVADQSREALNFNLSALIYFIIAFILIFVLVGLLLLPVVGIAWLVLVIVGAVQANKGEAYRYPLTIRFITS